VVAAVRPVGAVGSKPSVSPNEMLGRPFAARVGGLSVSEAEMRTARADFSALGVREVATVRACREPRRVGVGQRGGLLGSVVREAL
jgi:hypothetical protein